MKKERKTGGAAAPGESGRKSLTVRMTDAEHRRIKAHLALHGVSLSDAVRQALGAWLEKRGEKGL